MEKIDITISSVDSFINEMAGAQGMLYGVKEQIYKIKNRLNDKVAAKSSIEQQLNKVIDSTDAQWDFFGTITDLSVRARTELEEVDKRQADIIRGISAISGKKSSIKDLITGNMLSKYGNISGLFMAGITALRSVQLTVGTFKMETAIAEAGSIIQKTAYKNCSPYDLDKLRSVTHNKNGYPDYMILDSVKPEYCYTQANKSKYCTSCADATARSMMDEKVYRPLDTWSDATGTSWKTPAVKGSGSWSLGQQRDYAYNKVKEGIPVIVRLSSESASGHSVTVVGIRQGANPGNLTDADFLIVDPADGKIKTIAESGRVMLGERENGYYPLRVPNENCL